MFSVSPVQTITFCDTQIFIKRDDLLSESFSGNKARKFYHFLINEFDDVKLVVGSGSVQANSLYSLSALAKLKGWSLDFYVNHIPSLLKTHPQGNYHAALDNGANIIEIDSEQLALPDMPNLDDKVQLIVQQQYPHLSSEQLLHVPEGGRCQYAKTGIDELGKELLQWAMEQELDKFDVFLPSGTGTTSLYLQQYFAESEINVQVRVLTCSTVGGDDYLIKQFAMLSSRPEYYPTIISDGRKYHFGKLYRQCYEMWQRLGKTGIEFELLYDPIGFIVLEHYLSNRQDDTAIVYIHQGGIKGNETMLPRYQRKFDK
ncbi:1-aminocyclopropane-1-carboxylate deaminase/D-cysteine desulfhydrase [Shewanella maritima]|uniref:1-aminocyclopropane-1-carboxylate deaminase/D-cysteine desulfhydrase n=1 Tax=Shewanella maritima TaxID=2520507 RepID=UPI0037352847